MRTVPVGNFLWGLRAMMADEEMHPCVGICMVDPDSGYCLGCGRPPLPVSKGVEAVVVELAPRGGAAAAPGDPHSSDSPAGSE